MRSRRAPRPRLRVGEGVAGSWLHRKSTSADLPRPGASGMGGRRAWRHDHLAAAWRDVVRHAEPLHTDAARVHRRGDPAPAVCRPAAAALANARVHEAAANRGKRLATLATLTQSLTATLSLEEVLDRIVRAAVELFGSSVSRLWLVEEGGDGLSLRAHSGAVTDVTGITRLQVGEGLVGRIVATRSPLVVRDPGDDSRSLNLARSAEGAVSSRGAVYAGSQILASASRPDASGLRREDLSFVSRWPTTRHRERPARRSGSLRESGDPADRESRSPRRRISRRRFAAWRRRRARSEPTWWAYLVDRQELFCGPSPATTFPGISSRPSQFSFPPWGTPSRRRGTPAAGGPAMPRPMRVDRES